MWDTYLYIALMGVSTYLYTINFRVLTPPLRLLAINITVTFVVTVYAIYVWRIEHKENLHVFNVLLVIHYVLYGQFFSKLFDQFFIKQMIWLSTGLSVCITLILLSTIKSWNQFNSYGSILFDLLMAFWSGYYLWRIFIDAKVVALEREALFWVTTGLFFTCLGNFFVQGFMDYLLTNSAPYALTVYWIQELMGFVLFGTFLLALYVYLRYSPISSRR